MATPVFNGLVEILKEKLHPVQNPEAIRELHKVLTELYDEEVGAPKERKPLSSSN